MRKKKNAWKKWYDPDATPEDYDKWREEHRQRAYEKALAMLNSAMPGTNSNAAAARMTGLSNSTVGRYRNGKAGKRGPMLATYLMARGR